MNQPFGTLLLICGTILLLLGSVGRNASNSIDSVPAEIAVWYLVIGSIATVVGLYLMASRAR